MTNPDPESEVTLEAKPILTISYQVPCNNGAGWGREVGEYLNTEEACKDLETRVMGREGATILEMRSHNGRTYDLSWRAVLTPRETRS